MKFSDKFIDRLCARFIHWLTGIELGDKKIRSEQSGAQGFNSGDVPRFAYARDMQDRRNIRFSTNRAPGKPTYKNSFTGNKNP